MTHSGLVNIVPNSDGSCELIACQRIACPIAEVFDFFADASNLEALTPDSLHFAIVTPRPIEMRSGATIDYRLQIRGIPTRWRSEILNWQPPHRFVDVQLRGPYRFWRHEHAFREDEDGEGTIVFDHVRYRAPGGRLVNRLLVARDIEKIFRYRQARLPSMFEMPRRPAPELGPQLPGDSR